MSRILMKRGPCPRCLTYLNQLVAHSGKKGTFNRFVLTADVSEWNTRILIVPPPLHMKLGAVSKILECLDCVLREMNKHFHVWYNDFCPFNDHSSATLSKIGSRRENNYVGKMNGGSCFYFMKEMNQFFSLFFRKTVENYGKIIQLIPETIEL